jgi:hypothetical protein
MELGLHLQSSVMMRTFLVRRIKEMRASISLFTFIAGTALLASARYKIASDTPKSYNQPIDIVVQFLADNQSAMWGASISKGTEAIGILINGDN